MHTTEDHLTPGARAKLDLPDAERMPSLDREVAVSALGSSGGEGAHITERGPTDALGNTIADRASPERTGGRRRRPVRALLGPASWSRESGAVHALTCSVQREFRLTRHLVTKRVRELSYVTLPDRPCSGCGPSRGDRRWMRVAPTPHRVSLHPV